MPDIEKLVGLTITSIDIQKGAEDGTGFVYLDAIGADETPDIDEEVFDYKTSKPYIEAWSEESEDSTKAAGQAISYGNVRAQHGSQGAQNAAGTLCEPIDFDDKKKRVSLRIKVVDADAIKKVQQGVYRGISIKGRLVGQKWNDGKYQRYTVDPVEFSLVDKPANPSATITVVKADGTTEIVPAEESRISKAATLLQEMSLDEVKELIMKAEEIEKAAAIQKMKDARKAHDQNSSCLSGYCGHSDVSECAEKVAENHKKVMAAFEDRKSTSKSAEIDEEAAKAAAAKKAEEEEKKSKADEEDDGDADDEDKKKEKAKKAAEEEEAKKAADAAKAAEVDEVKSLKEKVKTLTETVEKMAAGKSEKRPTPVHPGTKVVKKSDEDPEDKDIIAKKAALDKADPDYVDKAYRIDMNAERELVKL